MSYPINQAITYTAVAATEGTTGHSFSYAWAFDDTTTDTGASVSKSWSTAGNHLATITATDATTLGTASANKTITCSDWSQFAWYSTGLKITPDASANFGSGLGAQAEGLIVSGNLIVNVFDYYNPTVLVVYDSVAGTKIDYPGLLGVVGAPTAGFLLTTGAYAGHVLILGSGTGRYGFFNPSDGAIVVSPNTTPATPAVVSGRRSVNALLGNGKWFIHGTTAGSSLACMTYDPLLDAWATASGAGTPTLMQNLFTLPSGNIIAYKDNTTSTYIYDYLSNTWSSGPTLPNMFPNGASPLSQMNDGKIITITSSGYQATWVEGDAAFAVDTELYPYTSQNASATSNSHQSLIVTPDNMIINVGGQCSGPLTYSDTKTIFHMLDGKWTVGANLLTPGISYKRCFAAGRAWRSNTGILEYSSIW